MVSGRLDSLLSSRGEEVVSVAPVFRGIPGHDIGTALGRERVAGQGKLCL